jgi:hypothetical protein
MEVAKNPIRVLTFVNLGQAFVKGSILLQKMVEVFLYRYVQTISKGGCPGVQIEENRPVCSGQGERVIQGKRCLSNPTFSRRYGNDTQTGLLLPDCRELYHKKDSFRG